MPFSTLMAKPVCEVLLVDSPLALPADNFALETGAIVDFWGVVRATESGATITGIEYEAHRSMAEYQLRLVAEEAGRKFPLMGIIVRHRTGFVPAGESSLLVRVGSQHRAEAFRACEWVVAELKRRVPIWKRPRFELPKECEMIVPLAEGQRSLADSAPELAGKSLSRA